MINRDLVAVMGLVAAVAILGGTLSQTMNQFTIYVNENQILKEENARLQKEIEELQNNIQTPVKQEKTEAESLLEQKIKEWKKFEHESVYNEIKEYDAGAYKKWEDEYDITMKPIKMEG